MQGVAACFAEHYDSEQPAHPARAFRGAARARANWTAIFDGVPDFHADLVRADAVGGVEWTEWRWRGTHRDGTLLEMAGAIVAGIGGDRMIWARLYVEPVEHDGERVETVVRRIAGEEPNQRAG